MSANSLWKKMKKTQFPPPGTVERMSENEKVNFFFFLQKQPARVEYRSSKSTCISSASVPFSGGTKWWLGGTGGAGRHFRSLSAALSHSKHNLEKKTVYLLSEYNLKGGILHPSLPHWPDATPKPHRETALLIDFLNSTYAISYL